MALLPIYGVLVAECSKVSGAQIYGLRTYIWHLAVYGESNIASNIYLVSIMSAFKFTYNVLTSLVLNPQTAGYFY